MLATSILFIKKKKCYGFIYLFLAVLGLPCRVGFSLVVAGRDSSLAVAHSLHTAVASLWRAWALGCGLQWLLLLDSGVQA